MKIQLAEARKRLVFYHNAATLYGISNTEAAE
jgi:hypothetical protein